MRSAVVLVAMAVAPVITLVAGCNASLSQNVGPQWNQTGGQPEAIYYGTPAPDDAATVALAYAGDGQAFCSGTLIAASYVLTAGHCVDAINSNANFVQVYFGADSSNPDDIRSVTRAATHPDYDSQTNTPDVGMLELANPAPGWAVPIPALPAALALTTSDVGAQVRFVGFGTTETGAFGTRRQNTGTIGKVCTSTSGCTYLSGWLEDGTIGYDQTDGGPCSGDSGGPAFLDREGVTYVAGVTSYGDADCLYYGASVAPDRYEQFITDFINNVIPVDLGCTDATCHIGAPCSYDGQCGSDAFCMRQSQDADYVNGYCLAQCGASGNCTTDSQCLNFGQHNICMLSCASDNDCRAGYECRADFNYTCQAKLGGDGSVAIGGACEHSSNCAVEGAYCLNEADWGFPGGYCVSDCDNDAGCPSGSTCDQGYCNATCSLNTDCRPGYSCWPSGSTGACWPSCTSSSDCTSGQACNSFGLCGSDTPPGGDGTTTTTNDGGSSSTTRRKAATSSSGCSAAAPGSWALLSLLGLLKRRWRS